MSEKHIIQEWANETKTTIYLGKMDYEKKILYLYSEHPGLLIGYHGERIERYQEKLKAFGWTIYLTEIQETFCPGRDYSDVLFKRMQAYFELEDELEDPALDIDMVDDAYLSGGE